MTGVRRGTRTFMPRHCVPRLSQTETPLPEHNGSEKPGRAIAPKGHDSPIASQAGHLAFAHFPSAECAPADVLGRQSDPNCLTKMEHELQSDALDVGTHAHDTPVTTTSLVVRGYTMPLVSTPVHPCKVGCGHRKSRDGVESVAGRPPVHPHPLTGWVRTPGVRGVVRTIQRNCTNHTRFRPSNSPQRSFSPVHPRGGHPPSKGWTGVDRGGHLGGASL